ncbi:carboxymuconolactone decarboxylase family protein [Streptomyces sp. NPDC048567]|uniref:carboxymuconolactone decarboxylase family protein n=1 Tax=Streptomyces sp. NPDC048567 TaxID=3365570 RepID=UPI00371A3B34
MTGMAPVTARAMRGLALAQIRHVTPVRPGAADGPTTRVYAQMEREFGVLAPPVALHSPAPEVMTAAWLMLRETLIAPGKVDRAVREAVAAAVSAVNTCPYCVSVHGATLRGLAGEQAARTIADGRVADVADTRLREAAHWATMAALRPRPGDAPYLPFSAAEAPEYVGVAVVFHYLNRMVNTFLEDAPMPASAPRAGLGMVQRVLSHVIRGASPRIGEAGASLDLLPPEPEPTGLRWAGANPHIAQAFARAAGAVDRAARQVVAPGVRDLLDRELKDWDGAPRGLGRGWVDAPLATLPPDDRPAARLALLVAFASYQIDGAVIEEYRKGRPDDADLVVLTSWAALSAALRIGGWAPVAPAPDGGPGPG